MMVMVVSESEDRMLARYGDWQCNTYERALHDIKMHRYVYEKERILDGGDIIIFVKPSVI